MKNEPAFPVEITVNEDGSRSGMQTGNSSGWETGLSKREWFAGMAMQGLLSNARLWQNLEDYQGNMLEWIGSQALEYADAIIKQSEKPATI